MCVGLVTTPCVAVMEAVAVLYCVLCVTCHAEVEAFVASAIPQAVHVETYAGERVCVCLCVHVSVHVCTCVCVSL